MGLDPASSAEAAAWLLAGEADWFDRVRFGPPGFEVYSRVAFDTDDEAAPSDPDRIDRVLALLAGHTSTPTSAYAAIWEGWCGSDEIPTAPRVLLPNREMLLFVGPVEGLRQAPSEAWGLPAEWSVQPPHLLWPEDRSWVVACEVDEEIEFTVAGSAEMATALAESLPGAVRRVQYGEECQLYRE